MTDDENEAPVVFRKYAAVYDALYRQKDYDAECDFLEEIFRRQRGGNVRRILDLGCGTGEHALRLAERGYDVLGIDRSPEMLAIAAEKARAKDLSHRVRFQQGDVRNLALSESFDAVICMFAVLSYQTTNEDLFSLLCGTRRTLETNGLFVCDFWYGPAVLRQRPDDRSLTVGTDTETVVRKARPAIDVRSNTVDVSYEIQRIRDCEVIEEIAETHRMRYLFLPELKFFLAQSNFKFLTACPFLRLDDEVSEDDWNVAAIARAV